MAERRLSVPALAILVVLVFMLSLVLGWAKLDLGQAFIQGTPDNIILFSVRLPRTLAAFLAGVAFSVSGLLLQRATGNDLSSPNIIGMNSGAGAAVLLFLSFFPGHFRLLPLAAFLGAAIALALVFVIASLSGRLGTSGSLILAGIAVNALFNAAISTISSLDPDTLTAYSAFSVGGFASVQFSSLAVPAVIIIVSVAAAFLLSSIIDVIRLGDEIASSMGYRPAVIRTILVLVAALLASSAVTFSGLLGFVGLVTPHIASFISGGEGRKTLLVSIFAGPVLVMLSDLLARTVIMPSELPAGVFMAAIGVPFFIYLLIRRSRG